MGLGFGDVVVTELLKARLGTDAVKAKKGVAVGFMTENERDLALALATKLRREGENVNLALHPQKPKKFFSHADSTNAAQAAYIGPDDAAKGTVRLKNMTTREEKEICLA